MKVGRLGAIFLFATFSYGSPLVSSRGDLAAKRQGPGSYYAITGATGGVYPRVEVRDLEKAGGEMWNLFLLSIQEFQGMDQHIIDSWYQIAGMPLT